MKWNKKKDVLFLAVGHGTQLNGVWDSGAIYGGYTEADLMLPIVQAAVKLLRKSGVRVLTDADKKNNKNMTATVEESNKKGCKLYASVHCDYALAKGIMFYYGSAEGKKFGNVIAKYCSKIMSIKNKGGKKDTAKYEVRGPKCPSIIFETGGIKNDLAKLKQSKKYGRAIAKAICKYLGVKVYVTTRTKLKRKVAETLAYMNVHHFKYCMQYKKCGTSWAKAKKTKKSNCATMICYAMQQLRLLKPGQIFWISGTKIKCVGKGTAARLKSEFTIKHPKKTVKALKPKSGTIVGYSPYHTQMFVKFVKDKTPRFYSWGSNDAGKKQPRRKKGYDKKKIMTTMVAK